MILRQIGHVLRNGKQVKQQRCPQGRKTIFASIAMQTLHVRSSSNCELMDFDSMCNFSILTHTFENTKTNELRHLIHSYLHLKFRRMRRLLDAL